MSFFKKTKQNIEPSEREKIVEHSRIDLKDIVSPASIAINYDSINFGKRLSKSFFIFSYPRYINTGWLSPIINLSDRLDVAIFIHPIETGPELRKLRKKVTEVQAEISEKEEKGYIKDPALEIAYQDLESLRERLQTAQERMAKLGVYITIYGENEEELKRIETTLRSILESRLIYIKPANYQQKEGFLTCAPYGLDKMQIYTPMNTGPLSSVFPFISFDLSSNDGVLYGINKHNNSLILFDRFSLANGNEVIFGTSGGGKSYTIKLEVLRSLMQGVDVIIIDPENEYRSLAEAVGGRFFNISLSSDNHINPFDLPLLQADDNPDDVLRSNIINLVGLLRIMLGGLTPEEDAIIDQALAETYAAKDITPETDHRTWQEAIPLMQDLEAVLEGMEGAESLVRRIRKFTKGTYADFFNNRTNISMEGNLVVFGIRDIEEELRPIAMFIVMRYIWNKVRSELKKRILVVDEAWWIMQKEDGASFLFGLVKRARKYWLGVTTVTQDVADFMKSTYGQPIITNSAMQFIMKQSTATIEVVQKTFGLTEEEKYLLLESAVGEGLFFAGPKHVAIKVIASYAEDQFITTSPEELTKIKKAKESLAEEQEE
ncbi:MAG: ATP-binding protein [Candidatus Nealsonbacteria bacterium]|nr:ATP-binding protein [Candidatus Nealsonbacteria bacterium]